MKRHFFILLWIPMNLFAVETPVTTFEYTEKIKKEIEKIAIVEPENFIENMDHYQSEIQKYFDHKKRVCNGEFSTLIINEQGVEVSDGSNKLSREERQLCFQELKALQTSFINNLFMARKKYLESLHQKRLKELVQSRVDALESLQKSFGKKKRSRSGR